MKRGDLPALFLLRHHHRDHGAVRLIFRRPITMSGHVDHGDPATSRKPTLQTRFYPITSDFSAWYAADYVLAVVVGLGLVGFGFYTSLAGEPLFRGAIPDE